MATTRKKQPPKKRPKKRYGLWTRTNGSQKVTRFRSRSGFLHLITDRKRGKLCRRGIGALKIGKTDWNIVITEHPLRGVYGYCDEALKLIVIDGTAESVEFLDTVIHEASHGLDFRRKEKAIKEQGNALSQLLTAFGYKN